jgi:nicotinamidase/pyrazinamidase
MHEVQEKIGVEDGLIIVDVQRDFCPGGALAVPNGDEVIPVLNGFINGFIAKDLVVVETMDWHPADHSSFKSQGGPWPAHCVQGSPGAQFHHTLAYGGDEIAIFAKGEEQDSLGYSAFENPRLAAFLRERGVRHLWIGGLATEYCVKSTAEDALALGFKVTIIEDGVRPVDVVPGDGAAALAALQNAGAALFNAGRWY